MVDHGGSDLRIDTGLIMLFNPIQHMRRAKLLRERAQNAPISRKRQYLAFAAFHEARARWLARNPNLSLRSQRQPEGKGTDL